ncbi:uncharacterized protein LOC113789657 isoform X2 [Dermatophagoides pteronyssinus]
MDILIFATLIICVILLALSFYYLRALKTSKRTEITAMAEHCRLGRFILDDDDDDEFYMEQRPTDIISETSTIHFAGAPCSTPNGGILKFSRNEYSSINLEMNSLKRQQQISKIENIFPEPSTIHLSTGATCSSLNGDFEMNQLKPQRNPKHVSFEQRPTVIYVDIHENPSPTTDKQRASFLNSFINWSNNDDFDNNDNRSRIESVIDRNQIINGIGNIVECSYNRICSYLKCKEEHKQIDQHLPDDENDNVVDDDDDDDSYDERPLPSFIEFPKGIRQNFDILNKNNNEMSNSLNKHCA